jgi:Lrp/AsnC family transcriptional regulator for asnA, asnC and gidA
MKIDELDKKILALLAKNGRISVAEMARLVDANERTVANRVNSLIEQGFISIVGVIHGKPFGYTVMADIFCKAEVANLDEVARKIAEYPEVRYVAISFGEQDISVQVLARTTEELYRFVSEKLACIPGIERTNTVIVPKVVKDIHEWLPSDIDLAIDE